jgi:hypothetical protein
VTHRGGRTGTGDGSGGHDGGGGETPGRGRKSSNNGVAARCQCDPPRRIRVAPSVLDAGPVLCGICDTEFTA